MPYDGPPFGVTIPDGYTYDNMGKCSSCGESIVWCHTRKGNRAPLNPDGISHFATCPNAADHRRPRETKPSPPEPARSEPITPHCRHSNITIAALLLERDGHLGAFNAVYELRCPIDGRTRRNTRLAATIHTLRHRYGWPIDTVEEPGMLATYRMVGKPGAVPIGGTR